MVMTDSITILLVDDDEVDREAVVRAFRKAGAQARIVTASDGITALRILRGEGGLLDVRQPHLVLLDLNMPQMNGHEFLTELRADETLADTLVFVLTTSENEQDIKQAYAQNIAGYLVKSRLGAGYKKMTELVGDYTNCVAFPVEGS